MGGRIEHQDAGLPIALPWHLAESFSSQWSASGYGSENMLTADNPAREFTVRQGRFYYHVVLLGVVNESHKGFSTGYATGYLRTNRV